MAAALAFGVLLGLATAAKFYPFLLMGPLLVLCWRAGRWQEFGNALMGAVGAWLVVNLPVMYLAPEGWAKFYSFSQTRGIDFGSVFLFVSTWWKVPISYQTANAWALVLMVLVCGGMAALALTAPRRPLRPTGLPDRRGLHPHQQGLLAPVRAVADSPGRAGPPRVGGTS